MIRTSKTELYNKVLISYRIYVPLVLPILKYGLATGSKNDYRTACESHCYRNTSNNVDL